MTTSMLEQLQTQVAEQSEALEGLQILLATEASEELQQLYDELAAGLQETKFALAELAQEAEPPTLRACCGDNTHTAEEPQAQIPLQPGQHCRFLAPNGRWYLGRHLSSTEDHATVSFLYPSEPYMLQPLQVLAAAVQACEPEHQQPPLELPVGSKLYVRLRPDCLYERAELLSAEPIQMQITVALLSTGEQHQVAAEQLTQSVTADRRDAQADGPSNSESDSSQLAESDEDSPDDKDAGEGLAVQGHVALAVVDANEAALRAASAGPQTDTAHFASWEGSTRGMGSKLMASMGYVHGQGLGASRPGTVNPLEVRLYRQGAGLGSSQGIPAEGSRDTKKRKRGGERSRKKKFAAQARANKQQHRDKQHKHEMETGDAGIFSLINSRLGDKTKHSHQHSAHQLSQGSHWQAGGAEAGGAFQAQPSRFFHAVPVQPAAKPQDRKELMAQRDQLQALKQQVTRLQAMAARNSNDKVVLAQVNQKLKKAQAAVATAEAATSGHESALTDTERQKKWMKF